MSSCSNMPFVARVVVLLLADFTPRALTQLWELVMWTMTSSVPVAMEMTSAMSSCETPFSRRNFLMVRPKAFADSGSNLLEPRGLPALSRSVGCFVMIRKASNNYFS